MYRYIELLPENLQQVKEYQAIGVAVDRQMSALQLRFAQIFANRCIDTADAATLQRLQAIFGLEHNPDMSLTEQRNQLKARKQIRWVINLQRIRNMLDEITHGDAALSVNYDTLVLTVLVELTSKHNFNSVVQLLQDTVPANLVLSVALRYNRWSQLHPFKWGDLQTKTWKQVREDVLPVALRYNRWSQLRPFKWGDLQTKTWKQVREDVLPNVTNAQI